MPIEVVSNWELDHEVKAFNKFKIKSFSWSQETRSLTIESLGMQISFNATHRRIH